MFGSYFARLFRTKAIEAITTIMTTAAAATYRVVVISLPGEGAAVTVGDGDTVGVGVGDGVTVGVDVGGGDGEAGAGPAIKYVVAYESPYELVPANVAMMLYLP